MLLRRRRMWDYGIRANEQHASPEKQAKLYDSNHMLAQMASANQEKETSSGLSPVSPLSST